VSVPRSESYKHMEMIMNKISKIFAVAALLASVAGGAQAGQGALNIARIDPGNAIKCPIACESRSGYIACVARCMADGQVCDSGSRNCSN
jgi:hypothetical protein